MVIEQNNSHQTVVTDYKHNINQTVVIEQNNLDQTAATDYKHHINQTVVTEQNNSDKTATTEYKYNINQTSVIEQNNSHQTAATQKHNVKTLQIISAVDTDNDPLPTVLLLTTRHHNDHNCY